MEWQPIETYDALANKPRFAAFYVEEALPNRPGGHGLRDLVVMERTFGLRTITHWMPLPPAPSSTQQGEEK